jgi:hypothetical protein
MRNKKKWRFLTIATVIFLLGAGIYYRNKEKAVLLQKNRGLNFKG